MIKHPVPDGFIVKIYYNGEGINAKILSCCHYLDNYCYLVMVDRNWEMSSFYITDRDIEEIVWDSDLQKALYENPKQES